MSYFTEVCAWDEATGGDAPMQLREKCVREEWRELWDAVEVGTVADIAKECADVVWTVLAYAKGFDIPFDAVWAEVVRSNSSKIGANGEVVRREDGKIIKPPDYSPPVLTGLFPTQQPNGGNEG